MLRMAVVALGLVLQAEEPPKDQALKHDIGVVKAAESTRSVLIVDMPDGQVTFDVAAAQVIDADGKPAGTATSLKAGDKVRVDYVINNGAKVSTIYLLKQ